MSGLPDVLPAGGFRDWPSVTMVVAALTAQGTAVRFVGGCVRDALLGHEPNDIDIATPDQPQVVMALAREAGLRVVPTGIDHGTVTVIADHQPVEVTTLRHDVETDGRRAVVAFTDDWAADALRRDFTINALYADPDGRLHDPVGGLADLAARHVRFIGRAADRLAEDYLRALRFFRFHARFAEGPPDGEALAAIADCRQALTRLSAERIASEVLKILALPRALEAVGLMRDCGVLAVILPEAADFARLERHAEGADALLRLAALLPDEPEVGKALANRLRLSKAQGARLAGALTPLSIAGGDACLRRLIHVAGRQAVADRAVLQERDTLSARIAALDVPEFPLRGADLLAAGVPGDPAVGRLLAELEDWWLDAGLLPDREACLAEMHRRLKA